MTWEPTIQNCDNYMDDRTGKLEYRSVRYRFAIDAMIANGLDLARDTVMDVGAGMTEFDYVLRREYDFRGRYIPIDGGIDGTDLNEWTPPRTAHWFVALELVEHLIAWEYLIKRMQAKAQTGIVVSTPNPRTTDVIAMDPTHVVEVHPGDLEFHGFNVTEETFYGSAFNLPGTEGEPDSLFGVWTRS